MKTKTNLVQTGISENGGVYRSASQNLDHFGGSNDFILVETSSTIDTIKTCLKKKLHHACSKKMLLKRFPILSWLPKYSTSYIIGDLIAGITVGLTVIPSSLAYAIIAGLPPEYGLYTSFLGCFVYIIFGSCKDVAVGPTAISALLTFQAIEGRGSSHAILLCFLVGIVQLLMGIFGLGFLIDFISGPVSSGFTSAVALIIATSQMKDIFGIRASGPTFLSQWQSIIENINTIRLWDTVFGVSCLLVLLFMRLITKVQFGNSETPTKCQIYINTTLKIIGISRNGILVIVCGFIGYYFCLDGEPPFKVVGYVPGGIPVIQPPAFSAIIIKNDTLTTENIFEMMADLSSGIVTVSLLGLLEDIAICKAFANGKAVDATQEFIAIGLSNIANSFVQAFPGTGAMSRSVINNTSGARTPLGGLYTGVLVIVSLLFFTPYFAYIPKPTLAAVVVGAVIFMVEVRVVKPMWRAKKSDLVLGLVTFLACLSLPLQYGIVVGIGINLMFIVYHAARPKISFEKLTSQEGVDYLLLTPDRCLIFPSADYVRNLVTKHSIKQGIPVVIDCSHIYGADYTAALVVETLTKDFAARQQPLFFYNLKPSVSSVFDGLNLSDFVVFYNKEEFDEMLQRWKVKHQSDII